MKIKQFKLGVLIHRCLCNCIKILNINWKKVYVNIFIMYMHKIRGICKLYVKYTIYELYANVIEKKRCYETISLDHEYK